MRKLSFLLVPVEKTSLPNTNIVNRMCYNYTKMRIHGEWSGPKTVTPLQISFVFFVPLQDKS